MPPPPSNGGWPAWEQPRVEVVEPQRRLSVATGAAPTVTVETSAVRAVAVVRPVAVVAPPGPAAVAERLSTNVDELALDGVASLGVTAPQ